MFCRSYLPVVAIQHIFEVLQELQEFRSVWLELVGYSLFFAPIPV